MAHISCTAHLRSVQLTSDFRYYSQHSVSAQSIFVSVFYARSFASVLLCDDFHENINYETGVTS